MRLLAIAAAALVAGTVSAAAPATATPVGFSYETYSAGSGASYLNGVNDAGQFTGGYYASPGNFTYFYTTPSGERVHLNHPSGRAIEANDINNNGAVVGNTRNNPAFGYIYSGGPSGTWTELNVPGGGGTGTRAYGLNDFNQAVGHYDVGDNTYRAFMYSDGNYSTFAVPGSIATSATGINNAGMITGLYNMPGDDRFYSFLYNGTDFTEIGVPGTAFNWARGINDLGHVIGVYSENVGDKLRSFLFDGTDYFTFELDDQQFSGAWALNNDGLIVGGYTGWDFSQAGFYGMIDGAPPEEPSPVPEPANVALMVLGLALVGAARRRGLVKVEL